MWIGAGEHFSFMNQPEATKTNFRMFAEAVHPLLDRAGRDEARRVVDANRAATDAAAASSGGGGSGASASPAGPAEKRRRVGIASTAHLTSAYSEGRYLPRRRRTQSQPPATDEPTDTCEAGSPESDEPGQVQVESWGSWAWKVRRALCRTRSSVRMMGSKRRHRHCRSPTFRLCTLQRRPAYHPQPQGIGRSQRIAGDKRC